MAKYKSIIILGAPGSGKGTLGRVLGNLPRFYHFSCGEVFRSLDTRTNLGKEFVKYSSQGLLVPDDLTVKLWKNQIENSVKAYKFKPDIDILVLDGIPRNVEQAKLLLKHLEIVRIFHLQCENHEELKTRIRKRAIKENRFDDASDAVIEERFDIYNQVTRPVLKFYKKEQIHQIDSLQSPIRVFHNMISDLIKLPCIH